ncbi:MAG: type II secretion system F family protein, partial [Pseudomonadota bacterium]
RHGRSTDGTLVAENLATLERRVSELNLWLIEAQEISARAKPLKRAKIKRKVLVDFFNGLATLLRAGVDLSESFRILAAEAEEPAFARVLEEIRLNVESGVGIAEAMGVQTGVFDDEICNLINAGEQAGKLVEACQDISVHLEWLDQLAGDVQQATLYPAMVTCAVMGLVFIMFSFVVPQFSGIFDSLDLELPALTVGVITLGEFCSQYWWLLLLLLAAAVAALKILPGSSPAFALALDRAKLKLPLFGPVIAMLVQSRFCHNMALLLKAGVPIVDALQLVHGVVSNRVMADAVAAARQAVTDGRRMSEALAESDLLSPMVLRMVVIGEETGTLDTSLEVVSERFDKEVPRRIKRLFGVLEPMIIMTLLVVVGLVAGAIFLPLFSLMSGIGA